MFEYPPMGDYLSIQGSMSIGPSFKGLRLRYCFGLSYRKETRATKTNHFISTEASRVPLANFILSVAVGFFAWGFAPRHAASLESLVIAYPTTSSQFTPLWFARDVGLYEKYNLDGKLVFIQGGSVLIQAMLAGQAQASQNGIAETVVAILRGGDLRMLGVTAKIFPYSLIAAKNVKSPKDLVGGPDRYQSHR